MSYSPMVLDHFYSPRNCYVMANPGAVGVAGEPGRGNFMVIYLRSEGKRIVEASSVLSLFAAHNVVVARKP